MSRLAEELLRPKSYHSTLESGRLPSKKEILEEWFDSINIFKHKEAIGSITTLLHYGFCIAITVTYWLSNLSINTALWTVGFLLLIAHFYHTFWYHRYCSHKAFTFSSKLFPFLLQWSNPLLIKEETYIIPHFVHHKLSDLPHDPYGPHLGATGTILATESAHHFNREMSDGAFKHCQMLVEHIPTNWQSKEKFESNGSLEAPSLYVLRLFVVNLLWVILFAAILKQPALLGAWYAATILFLILLRDFNYRGHDEAVDKQDEDKVDKHSLAVNQWFYGYLASEWHDNHHRYSASAKCGFKRFEIDVSFFITRALKKIGIIKAFVDSSASYAKNLPSAPPKL